MGFCALYGQSGSGVGGPYAQIHSDVPGFGRGGSIRTSRKNERGGRDSRGLAEKSLFAGSLAPALLQAMKCRLRGVESSCAMGRSLVRQEIKTSV